MCTLSSCILTRTCNVFDYGKKEENNVTLSID